MTALGGDAPRDEVIGGIRISEVADTDLASMAVRRGGGGDVAMRAVKMFGGLPAAGGIAVQGWRQHHLDGRGPVSCRGR